MMLKRILSLLLVLMLLSIPALAQVCALCGGDGVCDTCAGNGYLLMQAYGSTENVKVACSAGCSNGSCPECKSCEVCGGLGYLTMQAYGSDEMVKVACSAENCSAGTAAQPALEFRFKSKLKPHLPFGKTAAPADTIAEEAAPATAIVEEVAPAGTMLLVSPAEYTDGRVFIDEDSSSWMYSTTSTFDMDAYIGRLCEEYDMSLKRTNEVGDCIFYDLDYRHLETGNRHTLSVYTFSGGEKFKLTVIKPKAGGIALPEFVGQEPVTAKTTPKPTAKPASNNRFENAMDAYLRNH